MAVSFLTLIETNGLIVRFTNKTAYLPSKFPEPKDIKE